MQTTIWWAIDHTYSHFTVDCESTHFLLILLIEFRWRHKKTGSMWLKSLNHVTSTLTPNQQYLDSWMVCPRPWTHAPNGWIVCKHCKHTLEMIITYTICHWMNISFRIVPTIKIARSTGLTAGILYKHWPILNFSLKHTHTKKAVVCLWVVTGYTYMMNMVALLHSTNASY